MFKDETAGQWFRWPLILLVLWYLVACAFHFVSHRSLWNDELAVLDSIRLMKPSELFSEPLRTSQAFPHFYLYCIQTFAKPFGNSIWCLRFFPFVSMILAFGVWLRIARDELKTPVCFLTFVLCWIASAPLIYYSAELKQYSMDVLVSGLFVLFLSLQNKMVFSPNRKKYGLLLAVLPATVLFSYPACFFVLLPLWNLYVQWKRGQTDFKYILVYIFSLIVFIGSVYHFDIRLRPIDDVTKGFNDYFISLDSISGFFQTFGEGINNLFSRWFVELPKIFRKMARFFMVFGLLQLFAGVLMQSRKIRLGFTSVGMIAFVVFCELATAAAFSKYPFGVPRTSLFLCPMFLILTIQGITAVKKYNRLIYYAIHGSFAVYLLVVALGIVKIVISRPLIAIPTIWI